jgi:hypothetical protein
MVARRQFQEDIGGDAAVASIASIAPIAAVASLSAPSTLSSMAAAQVIVGYAQALSARAAVAAVATRPPSPSHATTAGLCENPQGAPAAEADQPFDTHIGQAAHTAVEAAATALSCLPVRAVVAVKTFWLGQRAAQAGAEERAFDADAPARGAGTADPATHTGRTGVGAGRSVDRKRGRQDADIKGCEGGGNARAWLGHPRGRLSHDFAATHREHIALNDEACADTQDQAVDAEENVHLLQFIQFRPVLLTIHHQIQHLSGSKSQTMLSDDLAVKRQVPGQTGQVARGRLAGSEHVFLAAVVHALRQALPLFDATVENLAASAAGPLVGAAEQLPGPVQTVEA